jgi:hypothetical protein
VRETPWSNTRRRITFVKRLLYLVTAALVAMLILVPAAMAQEDTGGMLEQTVEIQRETTTALPASGGAVIGSPSVLLPAAALLLGTGVLGYAVLRRRR